MFLIDIHERKMLKADSFDSFYTDAIFLYEQECNDNTFCAYNQLHSKNMATGRCFYGRYMMKVISCYTKNYFTTSIIGKDAF